MRWGAVAKEKTAAEQWQEDRPQDGGTLLAAAVQEEERQNNDEEQDQTALQHAHRAGFGFDRPFVEELMAQGQGDKSLSSSQADRHCDSEVSKCPSMGNCTFSTSGSSAPSRRTDSSTIRRRSRANSGELSATLSSIE